MCCDGIRLIIVGDGPEKENVRHHPAVVAGHAELRGRVYGEKLNELMAVRICGCSIRVVLTTCQWSCAKLSPRQNCDCFTNQWNSGIRAEDMSIMACFSAWGFAK